MENLKKMLDQKETPVLSSEPLAVRYHWIAWVDIDAFDHPILRQNDKSLEDVNISSSDLEKESLPLFIMLIAKQPQFARRTVSMNTNLKKIGEWEKNKNSIDNGVSVPAGSPVYLRF